MLARAYSAEVVGLQAHHVTVEVHRGPGLPQLALVGLARGAVKEAAVRVRAALQSVGVSLGSYKLVANMLPAELPKESSALDLPLALALMVAVGQLPAEVLLGRRFFGALSLGGDIEAVHGAVLAADLSADVVDRELFVPQGNAAQAAVIPGAQVVGVTCLQQLLLHLRGAQPLATTCASPAAAADADAGHCLSQVRGQPLAKRALEAAAAGGHHLLMVGPPGAGKSFLARRLAGILPPLSQAEQIEVTRILAAADDDPRALALARPFRSPHHTASAAALCGGGSTPRPGEITLAHRGVLFLDELAEFPRRSLESLREPLQEGWVQVSRAKMSLTFPAQAQLVAAMNPCPCGYFRPPARTEAAAGPSALCVCSMAQIERYGARVSGPFLDRIDLRAWVEPTSFAELTCRQAADAEPSQVVRQRVAAARRRQLARLGPGRLNAHLTWEEIRGRLAEVAEVHALLSDACRPPASSARGLTRIARVAATFADLDGSVQAGEKHVAEAIVFSGDF